MRRRFLFALCFAETNAVDLYLYFVREILNRNNYQLLYFLTYLARCLFKIWNTFERFKQILLWLNIIGQPKEYRSSLVCGYTKIDWHSEKNLLGGMYSLIGSSLRFVRWNFVYGSIVSKNVEIRSYNFILLTAKLFHDNVSRSFSFLFSSISSANV